MKSKIAQLEINATKEEIWNILIDFDKIGDWMPRVISASSSNSTNIGEGTTYTLNSYNRTGTAYSSTDASYEIISWDKYRKMNSKLTKALGPFKNFQTEWLLESRGNSSLVSFIARYKMRFGFMGSILDKMIIGKIIQNEFEDVVSNLKKYIETGEKITGEKRRAENQSKEQDRLHTSKQKQSSDIFSSQTTTTNYESGSFGNQTMSKNQQCKKCYGGLNKQGKCNQCDQQW